MLPLLAPIIGAAIGGGASLIGGAMQNAAAERAADKQMQFQENSAKHQYQWAMGDMRAAGLNPILAYKQGGSGTLSGSSYTPQNIGAAAAAGATAGSGVASSAIAASRNQAELANIAADTALKGSQDKTQAAMQVQALAQAGQANANSALATEQANQSRMTSDVMRSQLIQNLPKETLAKMDNLYYQTPAAGPLHTARRWSEAISGVGNAARAINPFQ